MHFTAIFFSILYFTLAAAESMVFHSNGELVEARTEDNVSDGVTSSNPLVQERDDEELVAANGTDIEKRWKICQGSIRCVSCCERTKMGQVCNWAFSQIDEGATYFTGYATGVCQTAGSGHGCGIFIKRQKRRRKNQCAIRGDSLKAYYNEIRLNGCQRCGRLPQLNEPGCEVHVDYVTGCRVRWLQPNMLSMVPELKNVPSREVKPPKAKRTGPPEALEAKVTGAVSEPTEPKVTGHV
ncbi:MAG: hypothetical protein LQ342_007858 [Letrouitia transgressa]|nr:MAG: hypothetical protein LQ342_007858 [Letrouitia transgressa]